MKRVKTEKRRKCRKEEKPEIGGNKRGADKERKGRKVEEKMLLSLTLLPPICSS